LQLAQSIEIDPRKYPSYEAVRLLNWQIGESGFTGNVLVADPGVKTKVLSPFPVMQCLHEGFHVDILFEMAEEIEKKKAYRIVGDSDQILVGLQIEKILPC